MPYNPPPEPLLAHAVMLAVGLAIAIINAFAFKVLWFERAEPWLDNRYPRLMSLFPKGRTMGGANGDETDRPQITF